MSIINVRLRGYYNFLLRSEIRNNENFRLKVLEKFTTLWCISVFIVAPGVSRCHKAGNSWGSPLACWWNFIKVRRNAPPNIVVLFFDYDSDLVYSLKQKYKIMSTIFTRPFTLLCHKRSKYILWFPLCWIRLLNWSNVKYNLII